MLDLGWQEFVMVGLVLVLVVGPKDMPKVLRAVAKYVGKARGMARDFQSSMMEVANQEEFNDVKKALQDAKSGNFDKVSEQFGDVKNAIEDASSDAGIKDSVNTFKDVAEEFKSSQKEAASKAKPAEKTAAKSTKPKAKKASSANKSTASKTARKKAPNKASNKAKKSSS